MYRFDYIIGTKTDGANPFRIFESLELLDQEKLYRAIKKLQYADFLKTAYWFSISSTAKAKAGMRCQVCNSSQSIAVHHRTYETHGKEHRYMNDLVVLCENCHGLFHGHLATMPTPRALQRIRPDRKPREGFKKPHNDPVPIPDCDPVILTVELIDNLRTNGAFTNATLRAIGMTRDKMWAGWVTRLVGVSISLENYKKAVDGRYTYATGRLNYAAPYTP